MRENKHNSLEKYMKLYKINKEQDEKYTEKISQENDYTRY